MQSKESCIAEVVASSSCPIAFFLIEIYIINANVLMTVPGGWPGNMESWIGFKRVRANRRNSNECLSYSIKIIQPIPRQDADVTTTNVFVCFAEMVGTLECSTEVDRTL